MRSQPDWVQAALDRKMTSQPGTSFCYDSPGMHLLSAILQKVTGMTELDFARQVPVRSAGNPGSGLGKRPAGLYPRLGRPAPETAGRRQAGSAYGSSSGKWDGRQIVPAAWVSDSVQAHSRMVGNEYGYGYGWWVSAVDFYALGRGGQFIRVMPSRNTLVVVTAGGPDIDLVFLAKTILGAPAHLPADPAGQEKLAAALSAAAQGSGSHASSAVPEIAKTVSGKTYACDTNPVDVTSFRLAFDDPKARRIRDGTRMARRLPHRLGWMGSTGWMPRGRRRPVTGRIRRLSSWRSLISASSPAGSISMPTGWK